ncbi:MULTISPECIES: hypothetical protein [Methylobacteriaceae]
MTRFTFTAIVMLALCNPTYAEPIARGSGKLKMVNGQLVMVCHTLICFGVEAIRDKAWNGTLVEPVTLDSQAACDKLNHGMDSPIACKVMER